MGEVLCKCSILHNVALGQKEGKQTVMPIVAQSIKEEE